MRDLFGVLLMLIFGLAFCKAQDKPFYMHNNISVILDTDMGNDIDDALALDMLFKYSDDKKVKILGIMNNKDSEYSTKFLDLFSTWYGYPKIPIGRIVNGAALKDYVDYSKNVVEMNDELGYPYKYSVKNHDSLLESHKLYRKILAKQSDHSVVIISVGFSTNLQRLLSSEADEYSKLNGRDLVAKKVTYLSVMAGSFGESKRAEFNIIHDLPASRYVFEHWPVGIVLSPFEVGASVIYPGESIAENFNWTKRHLLVDAYKKYRQYPYNRPTWDLTSVYFTVNQGGELLDISAPGTLSVDEEGFTNFKEGLDGKHYILSVTKENSTKLKSYFVELIKQRPRKYID